MNLLNNAFYAVNEKQRLDAFSAGGQRYEPFVSVSSSGAKGTFEIKVKDNAKGIPRQLLDKIFQPFFTTKPTGRGTGLGLSLAYDIIKSHGGEIRVISKEMKGRNL